MPNEVKLSHLNVDPVAFGAEPQSPSSSLARYRIAA